MAEEFKYDVFISYSHKDETWVTRTLLPKLESNGLSYVSVSLPKQQRETRVVKDMTPDQIAAELVAWIGAE